MERGVGGAKGYTDKSGGSLDLVGKTVGGLGEHSFAEGVPRLGEAAHRSQREVGLESKSLAKGRGVGGAWGKEVVRRRDLGKCQRGGLRAE